MDEEDKHDFMDTAGGIIAVVIVSVIVIVALVKFVQVVL